MNDNEHERIAHNAELLPQLIAANAAGDLQAAERIIKKLHPSADMLVWLHEAFGDEGIEGMDTREAERVLGQDWKERDFHDLVSKLHA